MPGSLNLSVTCPCHQSCLSVLLPRAHVATFCSVPLSTFLFLSISTTDKSRSLLPREDSPLSITKFPTCAPLCCFFRSPCSSLYTPIFLSRVPAPCYFFSLIPPNRLCLCMSLHLVSTIWHTVPIPVSPAFCHT